MANDKYINYDIDDPRAASIAEVMANKTAKRILGLIAEREMTASEIAGELGLPLNTIGYNIEKLLKAGLIEETKGFFWSVKGKKMPKYRVSNKKIVISPRKIVGSMPIALVAIMLGLVALGLIFGGFGDEDIDIGQRNAEDLVKHFNSEQELKKYIEDNTETGSYGGIFDFGAQKAATAVTSAESSSAGAGGSRDYSQTNVQVQGVDEADIVKNDDQYIYTISGSNVVIIDAYPADEIRNISAITASNPNAIFVNGDKLVVFGQSYISYGDYQGENEGASICAPGGCGGGSPVTIIYVYDITDRSRPILLKDIRVEGNYLTARMIDNHVYLVANKYAYMQDPRPPIAIMNRAVEKTEASDVMYYPDYQDTSFAFTSIFALDLDNLETNRKVYLTGSTSTIYVSQNNIYLTYQKRYSSRDYNDKLIREAIIPILPRDLKEQAGRIMNSEKNMDEKYREIMLIVQNYSLSIDGNEKEDFDSELENATRNFAMEIAKEYEKTAIMKVNIDGNEIKLKKAGEVPGHLLNQFSMDEYNDKLRVAATTGDLWSGNSLNHLFVLDGDMNIIGSLQGLAPGEKIYSARFIGNRAYMVTFKKVDPFYVIDLSENEPKVLGYLKIPGYSDYLHPYDENHIIGIGKEATDANTDEVGFNGRDFAWYQGVKIALFDVSDFNNPKEKAKFVIGDRGSDSPVLYDHKALLFDKERNLMVIPVMVADIKDDEADEIWSYGDAVFQGVYVFNISENGIELKGNVTHLEDIEFNYTYAKDDPIGAERDSWNDVVWKKTGENKWESNVSFGIFTYTDSQMDNMNQDYQAYRGRFYDYTWQIQRSLYIDNVLYTVSLKKIKANSLDDLHEINEIDLGYKQESYPVAVY